MGRNSAISAAEYPIGICRYFLVAIYAFMSVVAALTYGAAREPVAVLMTSFPIQNPPKLSYLWKTSMTSVKAKNCSSVHAGFVCTTVVLKVSKSSQM